MNKLDFNFTSIQNENLEKKQKELLNFYKKNKQFYELLLNMNFSDVFIEKNALELTDFYHQFVSCANCPGIEKCPLSKPLWNVILNKKNDNLILTYGRCKKVIEEEKKKNLSLISDFDNSYFDKTMLDIDTSIKQRAPYIRYLGSKLIDNSKEKNLVFTIANNDNGLTYLTAIFYCNYLTKYSVNGIFADASLRISELSSLIFSDKNTFAQKIYEFENVPVLVLNKISNTVFNDVTRDNILLPILNARIKNNLLTIITSELTIDDLSVLLIGKTPSGQIRSKQIKNLINNNFLTFNASYNVKVF